MTEDANAVHHTVSMEVEADRLRDRIREIEEEAEDVTADSDEGKQLKAEYQQHTGRLRALEKYLDQWGGSEFVLKELSYGDLMRAKDEMNQHSYNIDNRSGEVEGVPRDGFYKVKVLGLAIENAPQGAPAEAKDIPYHVGEWLYDKVDNLNTLGELEVKNCSPFETTTGTPSTRSSQQSSSDEG